MKMISGSTRYVLAACALNAVLAACGGGQTQSELQSPNGLQSSKIALPFPMRQHAAIVSPNGERSWMAPEAKNEDLVYVSNLSDGNVTVYSFLGHKLVGTLAGLGDPYGLCVDSQGNVWIVLWGPSKVVEYAHASTTPIRTLSDPHGNPYDCAVDPTTGNLAVTNWNGQSYYYQGNVAVYTHAAGLPKTYIGDWIWFFYACTYDDRGNLFADGLDSYLNGLFALAVLRKGSGAFQNIRLHPNINPSLMGGVQWDGKNVVISDWDGAYEYKISRNVGTEAGYTPLPTGPLALFWVTQPVAGQWNPHLIITANYGKPGTVQYWKYPQGGRAAYTITSALDGPYGVALSKATP
jgi:hypothetical protein